MPHRDGRLPHQEAKVIDIQSGQTVPCGTVGVICIRGHYLMRGCYADADATRKAIDAAVWLRSGDLGSMDGDGYVWLCAHYRLPQRHGHPRWRKHLSGRDRGIPVHSSESGAGSVFGVPDLLYGEEVMVWVQLRAGQAATEDELKGFC
jgi:fatty-acyl-CoA synthase